MGYKKEAENHLALSTCCCSHRFQDGYDMLEWMSGLGFNQVELSHGISINLVPGIMKAVEDGVVNISSVHNFCPLPFGISSPMPNIFEPTSASKREISIWKRYTEETIKFSRKMGSDKLVLHSGSAWFFFQSPLFKFINWIKENEIEESKLKDNQEFRKFRDKIMVRIKRASKSRYLRLNESFQSIERCAKDHNVLLGIENREGITELPLDADHSKFVKSFGLGSQISYWHDTGHAEIKASYGLLDHSQRLLDTKSHTIGFHLHDVSESGDDHQEIGTGIIDFKMISRFIDKDKHAIVLELSPKLSDDAIKRSKDFILNYLE
ncbi:sugar phosphate isomerase/epimerase [Opitutae bacterium]|nr:sugar phosphate isomerase/epimerase [Opitutae bacterium]